MTVSCDVRIPVPAPRIAPSTERLLAAVVEFMSADSRAQRWLTEPRTCPCVRTDGEECLSCATVTTLAQRALAGGAP